MVFDELQAVNVNGHTEKKKTGNTELTYLSWPWAWAEVKKRYPEASYEIIRDEQGRAYFGDSDIGYMVYTKVTIEGITHEMWLPVMDGANKAMKKEPYTYKVKNTSFKWAKQAADGKYYDKYGNEQTEYIEKTVEGMTAFDVNKTIMRCLVKNLAMFGLGLYIYAGEDLPMVEDAEKTPQEKAKVAYPSSAEMLAYCETNLTQRQLDSALQGNKVSSLYELTEAQLMSLYNWTQAHKAG